MIETERLELKRELTAGIEKEFVVFANTEGEELILESMMTDTF